MELSAFAERILFGEDLDEKLLSPEAVTDLLPRRIEALPAYPGRPQELRLQGDGPRHKVAFPGLHELENARTRGHVLHFFANHELLALELMALMLLRFPEAPTSFRMGIFRTMVEEQGHLRMYREQMERAGVAFGEIPVNAFFWRVLRDVESPLAFVTGMSMTFEQANLDFAGYYARAFRRVGDILTADVLDVVYEEEIGHVKHGVTWFDRWRPKPGPRFRAYEVLLPEGLSPVRAKGTEFDAEARRLAGLDDDYIEHLRLYRASKGRPPWVMWFNPGVEEENRFGADWVPSKVLRSVAEDFSLLMGQLAGEEDILLRTRTPSPEIRAYLDDNALPLPAIVQVDDASSVAAAVDARHIGKLMPWGVSPKSAEMLMPLRGRLVGDEGAVLDRWGDTVRSWGKDELHALRAEVVARLRAGVDEATRARIATPESLGEHYSSLEALEARLASDGARPLVVKAPRGASARGAIRVQQSQLTDAQRAWAEKIFRLDGAVVLEHWRVRVADLSWQLDVGEESITHYGAARFLTDARGQYTGALMHRHTEGLREDVVRWIHDEGRSSRWLRSAQRSVAQWVGEGLRARGYYGPAGIDAMIYREGDRLVFQPIIEVNTRITMGRVTLALERRVSRRRVGAMVLVSTESLRAQHGSVDAAIEWAASEHPPVLAGAGPGRTIDGGLVWLTDVWRAEAHVAALLVASDWEALRALAFALAPSAGQGLAPLE